MSGDSGRITAEGKKQVEHGSTGDQSSSRHTTAKERLGWRTRLSRSQTERPESSQGESASEAGSSSIGDNTVNENTASSEHSDANYPLEGPESSQRESATEAHSRRWQDTARERRISPPDQTTQEWKEFSENLLKRVIVKTSNFLIRGYLRAYLQSPDQGRRYLRELNRQYLPEERPQVMSHMLQTVMLTDMSVERGASPHLTPEMRSNDL